MPKPDIREFSDWQVKRIRARLLAYFIKQNRIYEAQLKRLKAREKADRDNADSLKQPSFMTLTMEIVTDDACLDWLYFEDELNVPIEELYQEELADLDNPDPPHRAEDHGAFLTERTVQGFLGGDVRSTTSPVKRVHYTRPSAEKLTPIFEFLKAKGFATEDMLAEPESPTMSKAIVDIIEKLSLEPVPILACEYFRGDYYADSRVDDYDLRVSLTIQTNPENTAYRIQIRRYAYRRFASESGLLRRQRIERGQYNTLEEYSGWVPFCPGRPVLVILQELNSVTPKILNSWIPNIKLEREFWVSQKDKVENNRNPFIIKNFFIQFDLRQIDDPAFVPAHTAIYDGSPLPGRPEQTGEWDLRFYANYSSKLYNYDGDAIMTNDDESVGKSKKKKPLAGKFLFQDTAKEAELTERRTSEKETMDAIALIDKYYEKISLEDHLRHAKDDYLAKTPELTPADKFLYLVSFSGDHTMIFDILNADFDINAKGTNLYQMSALHCAARYSARFIMLELMKHKDIDYLAKDKEGRIPSVFALLGGTSHEVVCWLMAAEKRQAEKEGIDYETLHPGPYPRLDQPEFYPDPPGP